MGPCDWQARSTSIPSNPQYRLRTHGTSYPTDELGSSTVPIAEVSSNIILRHADFDSKVMIQLGLT